MTAGELRLTTSSPDMTERLGASIAAGLAAGNVLALFGPIGAGKTCLVRGVASALGATTGVSSPTFTLVQEYTTQPKLFHLDLYRLGDLEELVHLGYEELFDRPPGICVVEWAERAAGLLPAERVELEIAHGGKDVRQFVLRDLRTGADVNWAERLGELAIKG